MLFSAIGMAQTGTYIVSDFHEKDFETMMEVCRKAEVGYLLHSEPFSTFGHYEWNPDLAPKGDASMASMVQRADALGIRLGIFAQTDAISLNDRFFAPPYYKMLRRQGRVALFYDIDAEQREFALRRTPVMDAPSTLNLLLIDDELAVYGTMEPFREMLLLHRCGRGEYQTQAVGHHTTAEVYKLWDSPERFVAPDGSLKDSVQSYLTRRIEAAGISYVMYSPMPDATAATTPHRPWHRVSLAAKRQSCTSIEELERIMVEAVGNDTDYGIFIDRHALSHYGRLDELLRLMRDWGRLRRWDCLTESHKEALRDPYSEWHLEPADDTTYHLYQQYSSRRYFCDFEHDQWKWNSPCASRFALRIAVQGEGAVSELCLKTPNGELRFPCTLQAGQFLLYGFDGKAYITDLNYNTLEEVYPQGASFLPEGRSEVSFSCEVHPQKRSPEVQLRYVVREKPEVFYEPHH